MAASWHRIGNYVEKVTESVIDGVKHTKVICSLDSSPYVDTTYYMDGRAYMHSTDRKRHFHSEHL